MIIEILVAGGGGAVLGGGFTKLLDHILSRRDRKVDQAEALTKATIQFTDAVTELNTNLHKEIRVLKEAIICLTNAVDEILPHVEGLTDLQRKRLLDANNAAKLSV